MTSRGQCPRGGVLVNVFTAPGAWIGTPPKSFTLFRPLDIGHVSTVATAVCLIASYRPTTSTCITILHQESYRRHYYRLDHWDV